MKTVPTLLTLDRFELSDELELFQTYYDRIQIDVADGVLVPNVTTQIDEFVELIEHDYIEMKPKTKLDFHLMVKNYKPELEKITKLQEESNIQINTVLINSGNHPDINKLKTLYTFTIGLDIFPSTEIDDITLYHDLNNINHIQIMTVEPGFQGSPFLPEMLNKITQLREHHYSGEILIDGGVNNTTLQLIQSQKHRPDIICIGSYLTKAGDDLEYRVKALKKFE
ncbi:MAG: Ribulose-phosphate 3-epimerase [Candidatus Roizmanbacteria bacterium GW2011_GWA2_37_7]|uniref:Ribulose-phosphate 3-epimerase n=1 Tax=Candidatus Roizmanbacteria bacterium GW2011_GWA2_37_7 TaxID=1618481 RepID=A0A0G0H1Z8_9BACT|nr:MAG: Ribulose-phosphate 3-epimerase [Candidatus Roizmanbacteria bacterium GW2011_GWA2_37_7]